MGGLIILLATVVPTLLWARLDTRYAVVAVAAMLWMGTIGFLDDYLKIVRGKSQGLVARWKLIGQVSFGLALGVYLLAWPLASNLEPTSTQLPLFKYQLIVFWPVTYVLRSEERRVGKECRSRGWAAHEKKKVIRSTCV